MARVVVEVTRANGPIRLHGDWGGVADFRAPASPLKWCMTAWMRSMLTRALVALAFHSRHCRRSLSRGSLHSPHGAMDYLTTNLRRSTLSAEVSFRCETSRKMAP